MAKSPLFDLDLKIQEEAQEFYRRRYAEELQKLADEEKRAIFPPQGEDAAQDQNAGNETDDGLR